jgi:membrane protein involved in D-alanine export
MVPYADFLFFGLLFLYIVLPTIGLGLFGRANSRWSIIATILVLSVVFGSDLQVRPGILIPEIWIAGGYALYQGLVAWGFLRWRSKPAFYVALGLSILPLCATKLLPWFPGENALGFIGISYVTFRALDVIFSIHDKVITTLSPAQFFAYIFFFPTVSSGPVDRYRRFGQDWNKIRGRPEFLEDLDAFIQRLFQGFLYKYIIAALLKTYWLDPAGKHLGFFHAANYMYAYTFYLFFDFAGYSAFAIGFSRLLGIRTPENFDKPFLSRNIRDFWNRWHISLSFWFRDHIYMRFLLAAAKGKWFKGKHTSSYIGLFLTFGLMGVWHGLESYYLIYGAYHALLLCGYDVFSRWNKKTKYWADGRVHRATDIVLTFHAIAFGLLIFSGHLSPKPLPKHEEIAEVADAHQMAGWIWDADQPNTPLNVDIYIDDAFTERVLANQRREEMRERGYGNGAHAFTYTMPSYVRDGRPHVIEAKVAESGRSLKGTPATVTAPPDAR